MTTCSAKKCKGIATRFEQSTWMFACPRHEKRWGDQLINLAICFVNEPANLEYPKCRVKKCDLNGKYVKDGLCYCKNHALDGSIWSYIDNNNYVVKETVRTCKYCANKIVSKNNTEYCCTECSSDDSGEYEYEYEYEYDTDSDETESNETDSD